MHGQQNKKKYIYVHLYRPAMFLSRIQPRAPKKKRGGKVAQ